MTARSTPFAALRSPHPNTRITVVIPARNEAAWIERALAALVAQRTPENTPLDPHAFDVLVYANNCDDATAGLAREFAARNPIPHIDVAEEHLPPNVAHIGTARRAAMNAAAARLRTAGIDDGILAATDADTVVAPTWIAWTLREMKRADVVTGRILVDPADWRRLPSAVRTMLGEEDAYHFACARLASQLAPDPADPWPRHWQRSGPSFAVRVDAYERVGGIPPVRALEDVALYDALAADGARIRHSLRVRVWTSGRMHARAPGGFGDRINAWYERSTHEPVELLVENPADTIARLRGDAFTPAPPVPVAVALRTLRQAIARGPSDARATRNSVASIAG